MYIGKVMGVREVLFLWRDESLIGTIANKQFKDRFTYQIMPVNDNWGLLSLLNSSVDFHNLLLLDWFDISKIAPLLIYDIGSDRPLSYCLISNAEIVSMIDIIFDVEFHIWFDQVETLRPSLTPKEVTNLILSANGRHNKYNAIRASEEYKLMIEAMYKDHHVDMFSILNLSKNQIQQLDDFINSNNYPRSWNAIKKQVQFFEGLLGLEKL